MVRGRRPTIRDVAVAAGVGVATVDRVINLRAPVKEDTALRVLDAARSVGFHATGLLQKRIERRIVPRRLGFLLQRGSEAFYKDLGAALAQATRGSPAMMGQAIVDHLDDLRPAAVAAALLRLAARSDAVAFVAADHARISEAVETVRSSGKPVFALLSDVSAPACSGLLGIDHRKAGRTAAWAIARLSRRPGPVAVMVGSHRYLGHELSEIGFRSYFREHAPAFRALDTLMSLEDERLAHEATLSLLRHVPDLAGLYVAGGGMEGVIAACRDHGGPGHRVVVCNELIPETRAALIDGVVDLVIATPIAALAERTVAVMAAWLDRGADADPPHPLRFELYTSQNV